MTIAEQHIAFARELATTLKKWEGKIKQQILTEFEDVMLSAQDHAAELISPQTLQAVLDMPAELRKTGVTELISVLDTTVELEMDEDDPRFFCIDGYLYMLDDGELFLQLLESDCVTPQDVIDWLDARQPEESNVLEFSR